MIKILFVLLFSMWSIEMIVAATIRDSRGFQKKEPPQAQYDLRKVSSGRSRSYYNLDQSRSKRRDPTVALLLAVNPQLSSKKSKNQNNNIHKVYVKPTSIEDSYDRSDLSEYTPLNRVIGKKLIQQLIDRGEIKRVEELTMSEEQAEKKRIDSKYDELLQIFHSISDKKSRARNQQDQKVKLKNIPYFDSYEDTSEEYDEYDDSSDNIRIDYNKYLDDHRTIINHKKPYVFGYNISKDDLQKSSSNMQKNRDNQNDNNRESNDNFDNLKTFDEKNVKTILKQLEQIDPHKGAIPPIEYPKKGYKNSKPKDESIHKVKFNIAKLIEHELEKLYNLECDCQQKVKTEDQYENSFENFSTDLSDDIENSENVSKPKPIEYEKKSKNSDSEKKLIETALNSNDISENLKLNENQLYSEIPDKTRVERYGEISTFKNYEKKPRSRGVYKVSKPNRIGSFIDDVDRYVTYLDKPKDQTFRSSSKKVRRHQAESDEDESHDTKTNNGNKYDLHDNTSERNKRDYPRSSKSRSSSRYYTKIRRPRSSSSNTGANEGDDNGIRIIPTEIVERQNDADLFKEEQQQKEEHQQKEESGRSPRAGTPHNSNPAKNGDDEAAIPNSLTDLDSMRFIQLYRNAHENILDVFNHFGHEPAIDATDIGLANDEISPRASNDDNIIPASLEQDDALTFENNYGINQEELVKELTELAKNENRKRENSDSGNESELGQRAGEDENELAHDEIQKPMVLNQNGIRIPLKVVQEEDGSFSLNLDYAQLCRKCAEHPVSAVVPKRRRRPKTAKLPELE